MTGLHEIPPELRCQIYNYLLDDKPVVYPLSRDRWERGTAAILNTCRLMRKEASPIFYKRATWRIVIRRWREGKSRMAIKNRLHAIRADNRNDLKNLELKLYFSSSKFVKVRFCLETWRVAMYVQQGQRFSDWSEEFVRDRIHDRWQAVLQHNLRNSKLTIQGWHLILVGFDMDMQILRVTAV